MEKEKLDTYSKILLATANINYVAWMVQGVQEQIKQTRMADPVILSAYATNQEVLNEALAALREVMEDMGNFVNNFDMVTSMDERITSPAYDIIIHGKDEVELPDKD